MCLCERKNIILVEKMLLHYKISHIHTNTHTRTTGNIIIDSYIRVILTLILDIRLNVILIFQTAHQPLLL